MMGLAGKKSRIGVLTYGLLMQHAPHGPAVTSLTSPLIFVTMTIASTTWPTAVAIEGKNALRPLCPSRHAVAHCYRQNLDNHPSDLYLGFLIATAELS